MTLVTLMYFNAFIIGIAILSVIVLTIIYLSLKPSGINLDAPIFQPLPPEYESAKNKFVKIIQEGLDRRDANQDLLQIDNSYDYPIYLVLIFKEIKKDLHHLTWEKFEWMDLASSFHADYVSQLANHLTRFQLGLDEEE